MSFPVAAAQNIAETEEVHLRRQTIDREVGHTVGRDALFSGVQALFVVFPAVPAHAKEHHAVRTAAQGGKRLTAGVHQNKGSVLFGAFGSLGKEKQTVRFGCFQPGRQSQCFGRLLVEHIPLLFPVHLQAHPREKLTADQLNA